MEGYFSEDMLSSKVILKEGGKQYLLVTENGVEVLRKEMSPGGEE